MRRGAAAAGAAVLLSLVAAGCSGATEPAGQDRPPATPAPSPTSTIVAPAPASPAIAAAESYLRGRGAALDPAATLVLAYLERRFGLQWTAAQRAAVFASAPASGDLELFRRLFDTTVDPDPAAVTAADEGVDRITVPALFCDRVDTITPETLEQYADATGYDLTHGAVALRWLVERGCAQADETAALRERFVDALVAEAGRSGASDVGIEAIATLYYLGAADRVAPAWIETVRAAQNADGGWGEVPGGASTDHATVLALWVLLEASDQPRLDVPWIVSPSADN